MVFHVFQLKAPSRNISLRIRRISAKQQMVIEPHLNFGHPRQKRRQIDLTDDLVLNYRAVFGNKQIHFFYNIHKNFVRIVPDPGSAPGNEAGRLDRNRVWL
jgi:hypothetical protein